MDLWAGAGTSGAAFLNTPVGARPAALGGAYSALATDAYAPIWNPAGLGFLPSLQLAAQHLSYLESIHDEFVSVGIPLAGGGLGVFGHYVGSGDIPQRNNNNVLLGDYSDHFGAYGLAYGHPLTDRFTLGAGVKWIRMELADVKADGVAFDAGVLYRISDRLQSAAVVQNAGSKVRFLEEADSLPTQLRLGLAYAPLKSWRIVAEGSLSKADPASFHTGLEWTPLSAISLRAGYRTDTLKELSALAGFSAGAGLHFWGQEFSYAWVPYGDLGDTQYFSLVLRFGESKQRGNIVSAGTERGAHSEGGLE